MNARLNETSHFYTADAPSLFWEMTICQSLSHLSSPYIAALREQKTYGELLSGFLRARLAHGSVRSILEIGGGYGTLMETLLRYFTPETLAMVDISPKFSAMQEERVGPLAPSRFVAEDIFAWLARTDETFDLVIANENMGDFDTVLLDGKEALSQAGPAGRVGRLAEKYGVEFPRDSHFAVNVGALELVEALAGRAGAVFLSEHSANVAAAPPFDFLVPLADGSPRRIALKDHDEYSIDFDLLEKVAVANGFAVERITMLEMLGTRHDEGARFAAGCECVGFETAEAVHEFLHHAKEYECALLCDHRLAQRRQQS